MSDLNALADRLAQLIQEFNEFRNTNPLERSSVRGGTLRFIGGTLILDTGATLELIGTLDGQGNFHWSGPWRFDSANGGSIAGNVDLEGDFDLTGKITADGIRIEDGKIHVGAGASEIIIDGADGSVTAGNVKIKDGKITVGVGGSQIVIDGSTGKITAGNVTVEPNKVTVGGADGNTVLTNSQIQFANGGIVATDASGGISMRAGNTRVRAADGVVQLTIGTRSLTINASGISANLQTAPLANWPGRQVGDVVSTSSGDLYRIV